MLPRIYYLNWNTRNEILPCGCGFVKLCSTYRLQSEVPLPRTDLSCRLRDGYAERGVAVQDGDADLEFGNLAVEVPRHEPLTQQFDTMHLRFDAASSVVSAPSSPQGTAEVF